MENSFLDIKVDASPEVAYVGLGLMIVAVSAIIAFKITKVVHQRRSLPV